MFSKKQQQLNCSLFLKIEVSLVPLWGDQLSFSRISQACHDPIQRGKKAYFLTLKSHLHVGILKRKKMCVMRKKNWAVNSVELGGNTRILPTHIWHLFLQEVGQETYNQVCLALCASPNLLPRWVLVLKFLSTVAVYSKPCSNWWTVGQKTCHNFLETSIFWEWYC